MHIMTGKDVDCMRHVWKPLTFSQVRWCMVVSHFEETPLDLQTKDRLQHEVFNLEPEH